MDETVLRVSSVDAEWCAEGEPKTLAAPVIQRQARVRVWVEPVPDDDVLASALQRIDDQHRREAADRAYMAATNAMLRHLTRVMLFVSAGVILLMVGLSWLLA